MKPLPLLLFMVALATHSLQAQDVVVYAYNENLNIPVVKPFVDKETSDRVTLEKYDNDQTPIFTEPIGNFLNISHLYPKNSRYQIFNDKGVRFLEGRLTANGVIKVTSLLKGSYKLYINHKPVIWFIKE
ncbi:MAG: hypothetical protein ACJ0P9_06020 [Flavobacteriaceae bacterium]